MRSTIWYPFTACEEIPAKTQSLGRDLASQHPKWAAQRYIEHTGKTHSSVLSTLACKQANTLQGQNIMAKHIHFQQCLTQFNEFYNKTMYAIALY